MAKLMKTIKEKFPTNLVVSLIIGVVFGYFIGTYAIGGIGGEAYRATRCSAEEVGYIKCVDNYRVECIERVVSTSGMRTGPRAPPDGSSIYLWLPKINCETEGKICKPTNIPDRPEYGGDCAPAEPACIDSDVTSEYPKGKNYYEQGEIYLSTHNYRVEDICVGDYVSEKFCEESAYAPYGVERYLCPNGCEDGACLSPESPECYDPCKAYCYRSGMSMAYSEDCMDTCGTETDNGYDVYNKGSIFAPPSTSSNYGDDVVEDYCVQDTNTLREFTLNANCEIGYNDWQCQYDCEDGACLPATTNCSETDNGYDLDNKGTVTGKPDNEVIDLLPNPNIWCISSEYCVVEDFCIQDEPNNIREFMLNEATCEITTKLGECEYGCKDGACLPLTGTQAITTSPEVPTTGSTCTDTDGGNDLTSIGRTTGVKMTGLGAIIEETIIEDRCVIRYMDADDSLNYVDVDGCTRTNANCFIREGICTDNIAEEEYTACSMCLNGVCTT